MAPNAEKWTESQGKKCGSSFLVPVLKEYSVERKGVDKQNKGMKMLEVVQWFMNELAPLRSLQ